MVAFDEVHIVLFFLKEHEIVDDAFPVRATVDVVTEEIKLVMLRYFEHVLEQHFQGLGAAMNIGDDPAL